MESSRVVADAAVMTVSGERSRTKAMVTARATVRRSRKRATNEGWGAVMEEESRTCVRLAADSMRSGGFF